MSGASAATRSRYGAIASRARVRGEHLIGLPRKQPPRRRGPFQPEPSARGSDGTTWLRCSASGSEFIAERDIVLRGQDRPAYGSSQFSGALAGQNYW